MAERTACWPTKTGGCPAVARERATADGKHFVRVDTGVNPQQVHAGEEGDDAENGPASALPKGAQTVPDRQTGHDGGGPYGNIVNDTSP